VDGVMSELVNYKRSSDYVSEDFSDTVSEKSDISGKSTGTVLSTISLLKLSSKELSVPSHPVSIAMSKMQDIPEVKYPTAMAGQGHSNLLRANSEVLTRGAIRIIERNRIA
jgi:hypothetical protein